ncbi:MAG: cation:dicarboxylase symporter family transporter [Pirellulales bacterium]
MKLNKHTFITVGILVGLIVGFVIGQIFFSYTSAETRDAAADMFNFLGTTFFMNLLKMILIPLVVSSVIVGVSSIGDPSSLGRVGGLTILYYFVTMMIAVVLGLTLVNTIRPGDGIDATVIEEGERAYEAQDETNANRLPSVGRKGCGARSRTFVSS